MPEPEKPYSKVRSASDGGRTLIQTLIELKTRGKEFGPEPDTFLKSVDYGQNLADEFEEVNPTQPKLGLQGREELIVIVYREMMMGKHLRGEHYGR